MTDDPGGAYFGQHSPDLIGRASPFGSVRGVPKGRQGKRLATMRDHTTDGLRITATARGYRVTNADNDETLGWVQADGPTWRVLDEDGEEVGSGFVNRTDAALHLTGVQAYRFTARFLDHAR